MKLTPRHLARLRLPLLALVVCTSGVGCVGRPHQLVTVEPTTAYHQSQPDLTLAAIYGDEAVAAPAGIEFATAE
jgi:hypothetical protein